MRRGYAEYRRFGRGQGLCGSGRRCRGDRKVHKRVLPRYRSKDTARREPCRVQKDAGIPTFIWIITNRKKEERKGKVQLINATSEKYYSKMKKSLGDKQHQMQPSHIEAITRLFLDYAKEGDALVLDNEDFGYTKITIELPRQVKDLLEDERFNSLTQKEALLEKLTHLESHPQDFKDRVDFLSYLGVKLSKSEVNLLIDSDKTANTEKIPLKTPIQAYYESEVKPYVPNSWIDYESASVGYEILFNKYFYTYTPPRSMGEIKAELESLESEVQSLLSEIMQ